LYIECHPVTEKREGIVAPSQHQSPVHEHNVEKSWIETAGIVLVNPLVPQSWDTSIAVGYSQIPGSKYLAPFFSGLSRKDVREVRNPIGLTDNDLLLLAPGE
jgi:hypothetical protein